MMKDKQLFVHVFKQSATFRGNKQTFEASSDIIAQLKLFSLSFFVNRN